MKPNEININNLQLEVSKLSHVVLASYLKPDGQEF